MLKIVKQTIDLYLKTGNVPKKEELNIENKQMLEIRGALFVTLYKSGEIIGSSGNIIEIEPNLVDELILNSIGALNDKRFSNFDNFDVSKINVRIDIIKNRVVLDEKSLHEINPIKNGIIAIKKDYSKLAVILPNISNKIIGYNDLIPVLANKLEEEFKFEEFIVYSLETETFRDF